MDSTDTVKDEATRLLQEARLFAEINSPHIIRYNHSWVEITEQSIIIEKSRRKTTSSTNEQTIELDSPFIEFATNSKEDSEDENFQEESEEDSIEEKKTVKINLFIQMELCEETLEDYLNRRNDSFDIKEYNKSLNIAIQIMDAIYTIHTEYKIIHRDLSLRNIFIGKDGAIKIGDFGLATKRKNFITVMPSPYLSNLPDPLPEEDEEEFKLSEGTNSLSSHSCVSSGSDSNVLTAGIGTKTFSAPEQMTDLQHDQKADIYSLGLVLLILFWPTSTLSERYEIIRDCRKSGPSKEFMLKYPEIGRIIGKMVNINQIGRAHV